MSLLKGVGIGFKDVMLFEEKSTAKVSQREQYLKYVQYNYLVCQTVEIKNFNGR